MIDAVAEFCGNVELCRHTARVVFSDPYRESQYNHWTSPYLDRDAEAVRDDNSLKIEIAELKSKYYIFLCTSFLSTICGNSNIANIISVDSVKELKLSYMGISTLAPLWLLLIQLKL